MQTKTEENDRERKRSIDILRQYQGYPTMLWDDKIQVQTGQVKGAKDNIKCIAAYFTPNKNFLLRNFKIWEIQSEMVSSKYGDLLAHESYNIGRGSKEKV